MRTARLYRTEGIVLRRRDQGEADRVLTLCTPSGKANVIAKGVRKVRSRKAGHVELFARSSFVVSRVPSSWDIVSQAETVEPHVRLRGDLVRGAYARYAAELLDGFFSDEQGGRALFELLGQTLDRLCERDDLDTTIRFYEQRLLGLAGFRPELYRCVGDHPQREPLELDAQERNGRPFGLDSERGGLLCWTCYAEGRPRQGVIPLSPHVLSFLRELQQGPFSRVAGQPVPPAVRESTERAMHHYITHHLERNVRSIAFLRQLKNGGGGESVLRRLRDEGLRLAPIALGERNPRRPGDHLVTPKECMSKPLSFQQVILHLQAFWAEHGCVVWQPYSEKVGAGTMNPATVLRVLGPEPWNVAYVEPSHRPQDGRYGENPNRMQYYYQYQVILKPDPGDPQELYLASLYDLGIRREEHDIRFVEDNWEAPGLGAWGLGREVWLDGQEITQFTYFQQAGGYVLDPVSVEITYGLERIAMYLQDARSVWEIDWDGCRTYGDYLLDSEVDSCRYNFELANVDRLAQMYDLFEAEAQDCLASGLVPAAHDYILRCSHTFNLLDARGAVGVTERATYFRRMRDLFKYVAQAYVEKRDQMDHPWLAATPDTAEGDSFGPVVDLTQEVEQERVAEPAPFLLEIGTEELPAADLDSALAQLRERAPRLFEEARLDYGSTRVVGTPRRLALLVDELAPEQRAVEELVKGPPSRVAYDGDGNPTRAAQGFARKQGVRVDALHVRELDGGEYVVALTREAGRTSADVLAELLPELVASLRFQRSMRWNESNVAFSRPVRWLVALIGGSVVDFGFAGVRAGRQSRGSRAEGSPSFDVRSAGDYLAQVAELGIVVDPEERCSLIAAQARDLAQRMGGAIPDDPDLLAEVANLVEQPTALMGHFAEEYLRLPAEVLVAVMKKHQRYFPVLGADGHLMPYFITVRNGGREHLSIVQQGNEEVVRARFADAAFFFQEDTKRPLEAFLPRLGTLTFQEQLGSMLDKSRRLEKLVPQVAGMLELPEEETAVAERAAHLCKADLATQMVVELTSLQGVIGREYALLSGEPPQVAQAILEHYLPRGASDQSPETLAGLAVGLADRLDSLAGLFAVGIIPSGSSDPYQLRRQALGIVQNLVAHEKPFSLKQGLTAAASLVTHEASSEDLAGALDFVIERLRGYLREKGYSFDVVDAVLAARGDDPYAALVGVDELTRWVGREDWPRILDNYARCVRITRSVGERHPIDPACFEQPAEVALHAAYVKAREIVGPGASVEVLMNAFTPMVDVIDAYFARESGVLVMAKDRRLRENRLGQLQHIAQLAEGIVDLSRLEGF